MEYTLHVVTCNPDITPEEIDDRINGFIELLATTLDPEFKHRLTLQAERVSRLVVSNDDFDPEQAARRRHPSANGHREGVLIELDSARK